MENNEQTATYVAPYHTCEDCGRYCYTGGDLYPEGYTCIDCDPPSDSDDSYWDSDAE
jgi:hypothetical protein